MAVKKIGGADKTKKKTSAGAERIPQKSVKAKPVVKRIYPPRKKAAEKSDNQIISAVNEEPCDPEALNRGDSPMTVVQHLEEFRYRLLISLGALIVLSIASFYVSDWILKFIARPFAESGNRLNMFKLTDGFIIRLKASAISALLLSMPLIIFHIWRYIAPAISVQERRGARRIVIFAAMMFYAGAAFVFFAVIPFSINVLLGFIDKNMSVIIGADDYLGFIFIFCAAMGALFELPVAVMLLTKAGILTPQYLIAKRRYAIVVIWIMAAVVTPPDVLSQALVALPVMALYELSVFISKFITIRKKRREMKEITRV